MRRRPLIILLVLLLGAIVNVAVAWGCAIGELGSSERELTEGECLKLLGGLAPAELIESDYVYGYRRVRLGTDFTDVHSLTSSWWGARYDCSTGLPFGALTGVAMEEHLDEARSRWIYVRAFSTSSAFPSRTNYEFLPLRPIWPGFAINTVFYAVILWGLFAAPFALRRLRGGRRIKRGLCPKCAYPVGTNAVCTECGAERAVCQKAVAV